MNVVLVSGGAGFIGSHVVDHLIDEGHEVIVIDSLLTGTLNYVSDKAIFEKLDVQNKEELENIFKKKQIDYVIHEAAIINTNILEENPSNDVGVSVLGTINLIQCCVKYKIKKMIFASSVAVYGTPDQAHLPISENDPLKPIYSYGIAKKCAEEYIEYFASSRGLSYGIARYVNIYGPRQPIYGEVGVIAIFSDLIINNNPLTVFGDGEQMRDFLYVEDAAKATVKMMSIDKNIVLNIGSGIGTTVNEVFHDFETAIGKKIERLNKPLRVGEIGKFFCSNQLAKEVLGWTPCVSLIDGLKMTIDACRSHAVIDD
jgi:UDP-glucose 4-epimerase